MDIVKPFDPQALLEALKQKGIPDVEKLVLNDVLPTIFDWLNSSVKVEAASMPLLVVALPVLEVLESKAKEAFAGYLNLKP